MFSCISFNLSSLLWLVANPKHGLLWGILLLTSSLDLDDMLHLGSFGLFVDLPILDHRVPLVSTAKLFNDDSRL